MNEEVLNATNVNTDSNCIYSGQYPSMNGTELEVLRCKQRGKKLLREILGIVFENTTFGQRVKEMPLFAKGDLLNIKSGMYANMPEFEDYLFFVEGVHSFDYLDNTSNGKLIYKRHWSYDGHLYLLNEENPHSDARLFFINESDLEKVKLVKRNHNRQLYK